MGIGQGPRQEVFFRRRDLVLDLGVDEAEVISDVGIVGIELAGLFIIQNGHAQLVLPEQAIGVVEIEPGVGDALVDGASVQVGRLRVIGLFIGGIGLPKGL